jgi:cytochrome b6-f complex iron-sulfur subunit
MSIGTTQHDGADTTRRSFLSKIWIGLGILAIIEVVWMVLSFFRPRKVPVAADGFGGIITAGPVDDFPLNSVTAFRRGHFYLCRLEDGGLLALYRKCTHLGCTVPWVEEEKQFACPCHKSAFDIRGNVISPPAPRALDFFPISIENGIISVDTSRPMKRSQFRAEQATYPEKKA